MNQQEKELLLGQSPEKVNAEIEKIKQIKKLDTWLRWQFIKNPITLCAIAAFFITLWYCDWNWKQTFQVNLTFLVEYFIIQHFNKKQQ